MCLTDEDNVVHNPPKSWLELCVSKGMCDSHIDALSSLQSAISRGFNTDSLRALPKLYIEHSFITENKADNLLSDIPVIREFNIESQVKFNDQLFTDPESELGSLVHNRPTLSIDNYNKTFTDSQRRTEGGYQHHSQNISKPMLPWWAQLYRKVLPSECTN